MRSVASGDKVSYEFEREDAAAGVDEPMDVLVEGEWVWERRRLSQAREKLESFSDHSWTWDSSSDDFERLQLSRTRERLKVKPYKVKRSDRGFRF